MANREIMTNRQWMARHLRSLRLTDHEIAKMRQETENQIRKEAREAKPKQDLHDDMVRFRAQKQLEDNPWFTSLQSDRRFHTDRVTMFAAAATVDMLHEHLSMQVERYPAVART